MPVKPLALLPSPIAPQISPHPGLAVGNAPPLNSLLAMGITSSVPDHMPDFQSICGVTANVATQMARGRCSRGISRITRPASASVAPVVRTSSTRTTCFCRTSMPFHRIEPRMFAARFECGTLNCDGRCRRASASMTVPPSTSATPTAIAREWSTPLAKRRQAVVGTGTRATDGGATPTSSHAAATLVPSNRPSSTPSDRQAVNLTS